MNDNTETALWEIVNLLKELRDSRSDCQKTLSGRHVFTPLFGKWIDQYEKEKLDIWRAQGVRNPMRCIACDLIEDEREDETNT